MSMRLVTFLRSMVICANPLSGPLTVSPSGADILTAWAGPCTTLHANSADGSGSGEDCARTRNVRSASGERRMKLMALGVAKSSSE